MLLDYRDTEMDVPYLRWEKAVCQGESLYLLGRSSIEVAGNLLLYRTDLSTGEAEQLSVAEGNVMELCDYEPGKILLLIFFIVSLLHVFSKSLLITTYLSILPHIRWHIRMNNSRINHFPRVRMDFYNILLKDRFIHAPIFFSFLQ